MAELHGKDGKSVEHLTKDLAEDAGLRVALPRTRERSSASTVLRTSWLSAACK